MRRKLVLIVVVFVVTSLVAACSPSDSGSGTTGATGAPETTAVPETTVADGSEGEEESTTTAPADTEEGLWLEGEFIASQDLLDSAQAEGQLLVYSGRAEAVELALQEAFTEDTGIPVENVNSPSSQLYERIQTEYGAGQLAADAIRLSDLTYMEEMVDSGILASHEIPMWDAIGAQFKERAGNYYATSLPLIVFSYNNALVDDSTAPQSWQDLLDPMWGSSQIGTQAPGAGGVGWAHQRYGRVAFGEEYWEALAAQDPIIYPSSSPMTADVVRGEVQLAINVMPTVAREINAGAPLGYVFPSDGTPMYIQYLGKTTTGTNPAAAELFVNWSMSKRAASLSAELSGEHHPHPDSGLPVVGGEELPPLDDFPTELIVPDPETWDENRDEWLDEWNTVFSFSG